MKNAPLPAAGGALSAALTSRRAMLAGLAIAPAAIGATVAVATPSLAEGDDAELLGLVSQWELARRQALSAQEKLFPLYTDRALIKAEEPPTRSRFWAAWHEVWKAFNRDAGVDELEEYFHGMLDRRDEIGVKIFRTRAKTDAGRQAQVKVLLHSFDCEAERWRGSDAVVDYDQNRVRWLLASLAGIDDKALAAI